MDKHLLEVLVCPVTGLPLSLADSETLQALNQAIQAGQAEYADGQAVTASVDELLLTRDQATGYRIDDGIPMLLPENGIHMPAATR